MSSNIQQYKIQENWVASISTHLKGCIEKILLEKEIVNILLSGGSTPRPVYRKMGEIIPDFGKLRVGLVDERFVPISSNDSNEKLLKTCFQYSEKIDVPIIGMVQDEQNETGNLILARQAYAPFINQTDIVVLGMGNDGHTASIFPADPASDEIRKSGLMDLYSTKSPVQPTNRITCSVELICRATHIYLLISGSEKWATLNDSSLKLPIHDVLERRKDMEIYYLEK